MRVNLRALQILNNNYQPNTTYLLSVLNFNILSQIKWPWTTAKVGERVCYYETWFLELIGGNFVRDALKTNTDLGIVLLKGQDRTLSGLTLKI